MSNNLRLIAGKVKGRFYSRLDSYHTSRFPALCHADSDSEVFLTFDDGPDPDYTPRIAEMLALRGHIATFFIIGSNALRNPEIVKYLIDSGHSIGSHSSAHLKQWKTGTKDLISDYEIGHQQVRSVTGNQIRLFRPPYGYNDRRSVAFCKKFNQKLILWDLESLDWQASATADSVTEIVNSHIKPGSVVLMHDAIYDNPAAKNRAHTADALERILDHLEAKNLVSAGIPC